MRATQCPRFATIGTTFDAMMHRDDLCHSSPTLSLKERQCGERAARREALPWAIMSGVTEPFMIPYALALGASNFQAGLLSSVRNLILSVVQLKSGDAAGWVGSRKRLVEWTARAQALLWLPLAVVWALFGGRALIALIALYTMSTTSVAFAAPAWGSLVNDYLAPEERGRFFSHRNRLIGGGAAIAGLAAGGLLHLVGSTPLVGFGLLCVIAAISRFVSCRLLRQFPEGPWHEPPHERVSFWRFVRRIRTHMLTRFAFCLGAMSFSVCLSSPFWSVYLLKELHYGYLVYTVVTLAGSAVAFLTVRRWGKVADRFGNWIVLRWTMLGATVLPLLWPCSRHPAWQLGVNCLGGFVWGGLNLAMVNFVYDAASPSQRTRFLGYFNVVNGLGVSLGALAGGWLLGRLPTVRGSAFAALFYMSGICRLAAALAFPRVVREVRSVGQAGLRSVIYDLVGERVVNILGSLAPKPEQEPGTRGGPEGQPEH